ncbi:MAG: DinB family protein [Cytophagales bacterium]|nr:DinB family protein [Cytophagales bacterium]
MEIKTVKSFLEYYGKIRERTDRVIAAVPPDLLDWSYRAGKFSIGDIIRHIATIERYLYAETIAGRPSVYPGCGKDLADGYEHVLAFYNRLHQESVLIFSGLTDSDLLRKCNTPAKIQITAWKWLRAMIEHEIHHRAQLYVYLGMLGVQTPPLFGLTAEEVESRSVNGKRRDL